MSAGDELLVVLCTVPDEQAAERLAHGLIEARLAACVNAISGVKSFYRWQGNLEAEAEIQVVIKTRRARFDALAEWIREHHPYDVPEIIALPADRVSQSYLAWVIGET
jgi:periplasmic divalent cation tolerance protein